MTDVSTKLVVLGDSIALGLGASRPADTIGERVAAALTTAGRSVELTVFAANGARSEALAGQVDQAVATRADLVVIIIGANDLTHFTPTQVAATQLRDAVTMLRGAGATVIVVPAPDLSLVPWVPPNLRTIVRAGSEALRHAQVVAALGAGAVVVDIPAEAAAQFAADDSLFSPDRFHPSSAGYALIAGALIPAVQAAADAGTSRSSTAPA